MSITRKQTTSLSAVRGKGQESWAYGDPLTASIEHVASAYFYCLYSSFFLPWIRSTPAEALATSAHSGWLHTDVYLVGLHRDVQIEQYLALEIQLKHRLGNRNRCSLSKDRYAIYTNVILSCTLIHHTHFIIFVLLIFCSFWAWKQL